MNIVIGYDGVPLSMNGIYNRQCCNSLNFFDGVPLSMNGIYNKNNRYNLCVRDGVPLSMNGIYNCSSVKSSKISGGVHY